MNGVIRARKDTGPTAKTGGSGLPSGETPPTCPATASWDTTGKLLAPERPGMSIPRENYQSISQGHDWGNGCIGKAGNFTVLGTVLVRFRYDIHEISEIAVVLNGYVVRRCR